jgi:predicted tellurium resistance membrane protein TerC
MEIHDILEVPEEEMHANPKKAFFMVILQIMVLDIVFSLDSIITAIGLVNYIPVMILAILTAIFFMVFLSDVITYVLNRHPSIKMLALSFLLMIGLMLVLQGVGINVPKEYIYGAMAFSVFVESLNIMVRRKRKKRQHVKHPHHIKKDHE